MLAKRKPMSDKVFDVINFFVLAVLLLIVAYPLYFIIIASVSDPAAVARGQVVLWPKDISFDGYKEIIKNKDLWIGYKNTIFYTVVGTILNVSITMMAAYVLSRKDLPGRNFFTFLFTFTMFFSGGLIPTYLTMKRLNLLDTYAILILMGAISTYNLIIARTFIQSNIPNELFEAASVDGCSDFRYFFSIVLPLSKAIIAVLVVYYAVGHWNEYFNGLIYVSDKMKRPLQVFLQEILLQSSYTSELSMASDNASQSIMVAESMKYGVIIVSSLPVMVLYPFMQKYFMKGVMIGSVKG
ncbi:MAG: carbohydrate ABC transporter permease [Angelakisella sp.]